MTLLSVLYLAGCNRPYGNLKNCEPDTIDDVLTMEAWRPDACSVERYEPTEAWWWDIQGFQVDVCVWREQLERGPCEGTPLYAYNRLDRNCVIYWDSCSTELPPSTTLLPCDAVDDRCCHPELHKLDCPTSHWTDGVLDSETE